MRLFVGSDVTLAKTSVCVISEHGMVFKEAEMESQTDVLASWLYDRMAASR